MTFLPRTPFWGSNAQSCVNVRKTLPKCHFSHLWERTKSHKYEKQKPVIFTVKFNINEIFHYYLINIHVNKCKGMIKSHFSCIVAEFDNSASVAENKYEIWGFVHKLGNYFNITHAIYLNQIVIIKRRFSAFFWYQ